MCFGRLCINSCIDLFGCGVWAVCGWGGGGGGGACVCMHNHTWCVHADSLVNLVISGFIVEILLYAFICFVSLFLYIIDQLISVSESVSHLRASIFHVFGSVLV